MGENRDNITSRTGAGVFIHPDSAASKGPGTWLRAVVCEDDTSPATAWLCPGSLTFRCGAGVWPDR